MAATNGDGGRGAERPRAIPWSGWKQILARTWREQSADNVSIVAAGVAFYTLLSIFPAVAAFISIAGLAMDPADIEEQAANLRLVLPGQASALIEDQIHELAAKDSALGWGVALGILGSLWSGAAGVKTMMQALNIVYDEREERGFVKLALWGLGFTLGFMLLGFVLLVAVAVVPVVLKFLGLGGTAEILIGLLRWPVLAAVMVLVLAVLYRYGPSRADAKWRWVTPGAVLAVALWLLASIAFSVYVQNFGNYDETYGSVGAVVVLMLWLWISAYVVLLGAELDAEIEHQTLKDTTTGPPRPMGARDAHVADTPPEHTE